LSGNLLLRESPFHIVNFLKSFDFKLFFAYTLKLLWVPCPLTHLHIIFALLWKTCDLLWSSGVARVVPPVADHEISTPQIWQDSKTKEDYISCLFKDIGITKSSSRSQSNTQKLKWVLFFIVDYESCFFLFVATFFINTFPISFAFLYMHIWTQHASSDVLFMLVFSLR